MDYGYGLQQKAMACEPLQASEIRKPGVGDSLNGLLANLKELHELANRFIGSVEGVLLPAPPEPVNERNSPPTPCMSPVADTVRQAREMVGAVAQLLQAAQRRVNL